MRKVFGTALAVVAVGLGVAASDAQAQVGFTIGGGPSFMTGDFGDGLDMGYHLKGGVNFSLPTMPIGVRAEALWSRWNVSDVDDARVQSLSGSVNAVVELPTPGVTPYIIGGVGYYNTDVDLGSLGSGDEGDFGINGGVGVELNLPGLGAFIEARLHNIFTEDESTRFIPLTIGLRI